MVALRARHAPSACPAALRFPSALVFLSIAGCLVLAGAPASAQEVSGALQGTVISAEAGPEAQVRVTLIGPHLQGVRETWTDSRGFFQFLAVPPGVYTLRLIRGGLRALEVPDVVVNLGRTTEAPKVTMAIEAYVVAPIVITGKRRTVNIDPVSTAGGGNLKAKDYELLPVDRDYKSIITILPGANDSYRGDPANVGGSTGLENQYYIDGVNVTDTKAATRGTSLPYNFVRQVDVKTGGYEAQYGRALGAVVDAVTYSGTNDFEMSVFGYAQPGELAMDPTEATVVTDQAPKTFDFGARVSGPVAKDRLWYSAALNPRVDEVEKEIPGHGFYPDRTEEIRFATKLKWQASPKTDFELSVFGDPAQRDQVLKPWAGITTVQDPDPLLYQLDSGGVVASLRATIAPGNRYILKASLAGQWDEYSQTPSRPGLEFNDYVTGTLSGGGSLWLIEDRDRTSATVQGTVSLPGHTLTAGVDYEDSRVSSSMDYDRGFRGFQGDSLYAIIEEGYSGTFHNRSPAIYAQDNWRLTDRFTLSPGLRWSAQYLVGASGRTAQSFTDEWQPRAGFSWQLGRRATQRLFGSYGRFYQTIPTNFAVMWFVDYMFLYSEYYSDPRQPGAVAGPVTDWSTYEEDMAKQIDGLQTENFDEFTLGYERLLGEQTKIGLRAIRRDLRSSYQWGLDPSEGWVIGTPGKGSFDYLPAPKREYSALEISAEGVWSSWQCRASYVLSKTWGNYPGLFNSDFSYANPGGMSTFMNPWQAENSTGYLPNDRTHVFKVSGFWTSTFGVNAGTFVTVESGTPINAFAAGPFGPGNPSFMVQRGTAGRTPWLWNIDLRLGYNLPIAHNSRWKIQMDLLHIGNPQSATVVDETRYASLDQAGNPATPNPNYKQPTAYQPPMAMRLGVEVSF